MKMYWQGREGKPLFREGKLQNPLQPHDYNTDNKINLNARFSECRQSQTVSSEMYCSTSHHCLESVTISRSDFWQVTVYLGNLRTHDNP